MAKTVHESKFSEWQGLDRIQNVVHQMKCIWREISKDDYGIDGEIEITEKKPEGKGYVATGKILKVQSKSGKSYIVQNENNQFAVKTTKEDLDSWHHSNFPVLFIIYHPEDDRLYYKDIKTYIKHTPKIWEPPYKVMFAKDDDVFDDLSLDRLKQTVQHPVSRIQENHSEELYSNLLPFLDDLPPVHVIRTPIES